MKTFSVDFLAGETKTYIYDADFFRIISSTAALNVTYFKDSHTIDQDAKAVLAGYWARPENGFTRFDIYSYQNQTVIFAVSNGDGGYDRVTGEVSVLDGGRSRTLAGSTFLSSVASTGNAGCFPTLQLFNPAASGKNLIIEALSLNSSTAQVVAAGINNVSVTGTVANNAVSKLSGGADGVGQLVFNPALNAYPAGFRLQIYQYIAAQAFNVVNLREPIVLKPGFGFCIQGQAAASNMYSNIEHYEELI